MATEIRRQHVYGNFRPERKPKTRRRSAVARRDGNDETYLALVRQLRCCIPSCTALPPNDPHHLKSGAARRERGIGMKATDRHAVPLCRHHHDMLEALPSPQELDWFKEMGLDDPHALAEALFAAYLDALGKTLEQMQVLVIMAKTEGE